MKNKNLNTIYNYLVALIFLELVLGGLGHLFGLPIRKGLFVVGILATVIMMYINNVRLKKMYIVPVIVVIIYALYGSVVGLINGNNIREIFSDANSFLGIVYIILLANYFNEDFKKIDKAMNIFINTAVVVAIITIGLFFYSRLYLPQDQGIIIKYMNLNDIFQYGLITGLVHSNNYARVYLFNGIFMEIGALILMVRLLSAKLEGTIWKNLKLITLLIAIFVSNTRGFWVGTAVGLVFLFAYYIWKRKERNLTLKRLVAVFAIFYMFTLVLPMTINHSYDNLPDQVESGTENAKDRVKSIVDFKENLSNKVRVIQLEFLFKKIKEKPILGWGFGANIQEYGQYMKDNNLPPVDTSNFELYYVELIFKTGVIGILYLCGYLIYKFVQLLIVLVKYKLEETDERVLISWTIAFLGFLASSLTNPYLASLSGFFVLVMECYILEVVIEKYMKR